MFSCVCIKMSKTLSAKYYQESKERLRYQNLSKEDKKKKAAIWSWIFQKSLRGWKTKKLVQHLKKYYRMRKTPYYQK